MRYPIRFSLAVLFFVVLVGGRLGNSQSESRGTPLLTERAARGRTIFKERCRICHDVYTNGAKVLVGPTLDGLFQRRTLLVGKPVTEENVTEVIRIGPTPGMPGFRYTLSDEEISTLVEFLKTK